MRTEVVTFIDIKHELYTEPEKITTETTMTAHREDVQLHDTAIRLIGIPFFGIVIPNVAGLFGGLGIADWSYWFGYLYFIFLATLIWQGNRFLLFRTRQRLTWFDRPIEKIVLLVINNIFYTAPLTVFMLWGWYRLAGMEPINWRTIQTVALINVICVLFVTHVYETVFLLKEKESELVKNEQLQRARAEAELTALKNQVDPHFMFNSLNTLSHLITTDPAKALAFTENLADIYRYILSQKDRTLVLLEDELDFTNKYIELLRLRFGNALVIQKHFNGTAGKEFLIPPTSVFVAFENAVKHNEISEHSPMPLDMYVIDGQFVVVNRIREKPHRNPSPRIGLANLAERFRIICGKDIYAARKNDRFVVKLPLVPLTT